jgi:hypothetical protein
MLIVFDVVRWGKPEPHLIDDLRVYGSHLEPHLVLFEDNGKGNATGCGTGNGFGDGDVKIRRAY